jgi:lipoprotein-anchoring transpeptidase ErfK/SrfK
MTALAVAGGLAAATWLVGGAAPPVGVETVGLRSSQPAVHSRPGGPAVARLEVRTPYRSRTRLWVRARRDGWLKVAAIDAPGGTGWIAERHVVARPRLSRRIEIDRSARRLSVIGTRGRWSTPVVMGAPTTPTPLGTFQVTDRLPGWRMHGVYGAWILVLSAYGTPAHTSRVAIHGVPPAARSKAWSAGCIRVPMPALARLAREAPPGTPVRIRA